MQPSWEQNAIKHKSHIQKYCSISLDLPFQSVGQLIIFSDFPSCNLSAMLDITLYIAISPITVDIASMNITILILSLTCSVHDVGQG